MRSLAIDRGGKRIGLALSDAGGRWATPHDVLHTGSAHQAAIDILRLIEREGVERLVVGLPLNMDGTAGPSARRVVTWAADLAQKAGQPLVFVDERLSSFQAEQQLIDRKRAGEKLTRQRKKRQLDALAAAAFLQAFLDGQVPAINVEDIVR